MEKILTTATKIILGLIAAAVILTAATLTGLCLLPFLLPYILVRLSTPLPKDIGRRPQQVSLN